MSCNPFTRRRALAFCGSLFAGSPRLRAQRLAGEPPGRITPLSEAINAFEFEDVAQRKLDSATYTEIAGSDRKYIDRITFNPRLAVNTSKLDLTTTLFGQSLFAPILVGPTSEQKRFHPEGELAMARGASAAKAVMIVASRSSYPIDQIAAQSKNPLWYQVYPESDLNSVRSRMNQAVNAGCKVVVITVGLPAAGFQALGARSGTQPTLIDWSAIDRLRQGLTVPVVLKGIMTPEDAQAAISRGIQGIVVSNYGPPPSVAGAISSLEVLPAIAEAVGGKASILMDGNMRRGSDVLKALALGAQGVLLGRPSLWGLAAYGADGVQGVLELIQTDLARYMVMCGLVNIGAITRAVVTIHRQ
jgi:4-hydroxymandelate oxidase